jgi:hypothetical protein
MALENEEGYLPGLNPALGICWLYPRPRHAHFALTPNQLALLSARERVGTFKRKTPASNFVKIEQTG